MSTPTLSVAGALPVMPVTATDEVTAAPASGTSTLVSLLNVLPPGGVVPLTASSASTRPSP